MEVETAQAVRMPPTYITGEALPLRSRDTAYVASDFPGLRILGAHTGWPWVEELMSVCYKWEHVWFGIDAWMPKYLKPEIVNFIGSRMGQDRAVWGTNGLPWKDSLDQMDALGLRPEARRKLIRDNARELFRI